MKKSNLAMGVLVCISFGLTAQDSILVKFQSESPLDSIAVENLTNLSYRVLVDADRILYFFPPGETVNNPTHANERRELTNGPLIYPNPFQGRTNVEFYSSLSSRIHLSVYDLAGNLVTGFDLDSNRDIQRFSVQLDAPGLYLFRISDGRNVRAGLMVNMGSSYEEPAIEYEGPGNLFPALQEGKGITPNSTLKSSTVDEITDSTAILGDLLRLTGYSGANVDVIYDRLLSDSTYIFHFREFAPGVYLQQHDTLPYALDTIYCYATNSGYYFTCDAGGETIFSRDSIILQPVTLGGNYRPVYGWEIENPAAWIIDTTFISTGVLHPASFSKDTSMIRLQDFANKYSAEFMLIMDPEDFVGPGIVIGEIQNDNTLDEISGMAASVKNPGTYWVHNDSGDEARIFLIDTEGYIICTVNIDTDFTHNRDWEDICVGPGPVEGESYIYIAEIGDLDKEYDNKYIFRVVEPTINLETKGERMNIPGDAVSTITFDYKYGPRDAEILMIDPLTRDLYIVTKREEKVQVFPIPYPQNYDEKMIITKSSVFLPFRMANGGDISSDGKEILIKNLDTVYYWKLQEGETILDALAREGRKLPYTREPQGEAIAWMRDGTGYLTVSEARDNITPKIYLYKRQW